MIRNKWMGKGVEGARTILPDGWRKVYLSLLSTKMLFPSIYNFYMKCLDGLCGEYSETLKQ